MNNLNDFSDNVNAELDHRMLQKMVDDGELSVGDLAEAEIISDSPCCGADIHGREAYGGPNLVLFCSKCRGLLNPGERDE